MSIVPIESVAIESVPIESVPIESVLIGIEAAVGAAPVVGIEESIDVVDTDPGIDDSEVSEVVDAAAAGPGAVFVDAVELPQAASIVVPSASAPKTRRDCMIGILLKSVNANRDERE